MGSTAWAGVPIDTVLSAGVGFRQWIFRMSRGAAGEPTGFGSNYSHEEKLMAIWGADVEQLRTLGSKLQHGANEIDQQRSNLTSLLNQTDWKGPDADRFKEQWNGEHTTMLNKVAEALKEAGQKAKRNAEEQSNASQPS
jgi:hypothetical protein